MSSSQKSDKQPRPLDRVKAEPSDPGILADHFYQLVAMDPDNLRAWQQWQADQPLQKGGRPDERSRKLGQQRTELLKGRQAPAAPQIKGDPDER
jgi:hypothetical protein